MQFKMKGSAKSRMRDSSVVISELKEKQRKSGTGSQSSEWAPGFLAGGSQFLLNWKNKAAQMPLVRGPGPLAQVRCVWSKPHALKRKPLSPREITGDAGHGGCRALTSFGWC